MTLWDPMDCSPQGSSVRGISQARILEWVAISSSKGSFWIRDQTLVSCIGKWILYHWATWEAPPLHVLLKLNVPTKPIFPFPFLLSTTALQAFFLFLCSILHISSWSFRSILSALPLLLTASSNWSPSYVHSFSESIFKLRLFQSMTFTTSLLNHCNSHHGSSILSTVSERYSWSRVSNIYCGPP